MEFNWESFLHPYELTVDELKMKLQGIRAQYKMKGMHSPIESVRVRVKTISSIIDKSERMNIHLSEIGEKMYDIAGVRINCQFVEDIFKVVEMFKHRRDVTIFAERDFITFPKESGYRSYHVHGYYHLETIDGVRKVKFEVQIRTMAMNFWATIEHSLNYKYEGEIPHNIKIKMKRASEAAASLDNEMSEIKNEISEAQMQFKDKQTKHLKLLPKNVDKNE